jgi:CRP-like cAMP-binding protein
MKKTIHMEKTAPGKRKNKRALLFDAKALLVVVGAGKKILKIKKNQVVFAQGDASDAVFYILEGRVKLVVVSTRGKEAVVSVLERNAFFGEACLHAQTIRMATAISMGESKIDCIQKAAMIRVLRDKPAFSELFMSYLLGRNIRIEEDLVDQLFNSSEKRLARALLLLAHFGKESKTEVLIPKISQETLAEMIGTTRSRVSFFMNKFKKLGFIDSNDGLRIHSSLLNIVLHD